MLVRPRSRKRPNILIKVSDINLKRMSKSRNTYRAFALSNDMSVMQSVD